MTLAQLSITVALLGGLGLVASRVGLSAIPAYLLAGLLLGPHEPKALSIVQPSEVTDFVAEIGLIFLLFFLGLEFTLGRIARSRGYVFYGGAIDVVVNGALGLLETLRDALPWNQWAAARAGRRGQRRPGHERERC